MRINVANVATNGGTRRPTTKPAFSSPTTAPNPRQRARAASNRTSSPSLTRATITIAKAITAPTDRSMAPAMSTIV